MNKQKNQNAQTSMRINRAKECTAALSAEAALVLPIFFFAMYAILLLFHVMELQDRLHHAATTVGTELARYGWVLEYVDTDAIFDALTQDEGDVEEAESGGMGALLEGLQIQELLGAVAGEQYIRFRMKQETAAVDWSRLCLKDGFEGILFLGSRVMDEDDCITIRMCYAVEIPLPFGYRQTFELRQTVRVRAFSGHAVALRLEEIDPPEDAEESSDEEPEEADEEEPVYVYVAARASVYHETRQCTHLKLTIWEREYSELDKLRRNGGGRYSACEVCVKAVVPLAEETIYVCPEGDRYHLRLTCGGLTRTVSKCRLEEVSHLRKCSRCAATKK